MASNAAGGKRALSGRHSDPIRNNLTLINAKENAGKPLQQQDYRCNSCMVQVSGRAHRMKEHVDKCNARLKVSDVIG